MFGLPRVKSEKSWEKQPRKDGRCLCCKCPLQSEELSKYIPVVPHDLWLEVDLFEFLCSGVSIHRGGQHPATVSACFDISCGICWEILFLLWLRAMGSPSELGLNLCSTDVRWRPVTSLSLHVSVKCTLQCGDAHGDLA